MILFPIIFGQILAKGAFLASEDKQDSLQKVKLINNLLKHRSDRQKIGLTENRIDRKN